MVEIDTTKTTLAVCCDAGFLPGAHVALWSALTKVSSAEVTVVWVYWRVSGEDRRLLRETVQLACARAKLKEIEFSPGRLAGLPSLFGSHLTYARLYLPDLLEEDRVLYLDTDVVVDCDLAQAYAANLGSHWLGAPYGGGTMASAIEGDFICSYLGLASDTPYFNAGVIVLDLALWRELNISESCEDLLKDYGANLRLHDQTVLNMLCRGSFAKLPAIYNVGMYERGQSMLEARGGVAHFVGRPKPFDPLASLFAPGVREFFEILDKTALAGWRPDVWRLLGRDRGLLRSYVRKTLKTLRPGR